MRLLQAIGKQKDEKWGRFWARVRVYAICKWIWPHGFSGAHFVANRCEYSWKGRAHDVRLTVRDRSRPDAYSREELLRILETIRAEETRTGWRVPEPDEPVPFKWDPWDKFKSEPEGAMLPILRPPCQHCEHWKPHVRVGKYAGVGMCNAGEQYKDFSCFDGRKDGL